MKKIIATASALEASQFRILTERSPEAQALGKSRRFAHIIDYLSANGSNFTNDALINDTIGNGSLLRRSFATLASVPRLLRSTRRKDRLLVLGLGEAHMLVVAIALAIAGRNVIFDACDSWVLQAVTRRTAGRRLRAIIPQFGGLLQLASSSRLRVSYISARDAEADARILRRRSFIVIPPTAPRELSALPAPGGRRVRRVVVVADMTSPHNADGLSNILSAWRSLRPDYQDVQLELFGRGLPDVAEAGTTVRGWAPSISDVYRGDTAVFVTNRLESGVPNKLVEAVAARRPVLIHSSLHTLVEPHEWIVQWEDDLTEGLASLLDVPLNPRPLAEMRLR